jgi:hypothetical protein
MIHEERYTKIGAHLQKEQEFVPDKNFFIPHRIWAFTVPGPGYSSKNRSDTIMNLCAHNMTGIGQGVQRKLVLYVKKRKTWCKSIFLPVKVLLASFIVVRRK